MARGRDKVALVTGASREIGAEAAARLAQGGFHVVVNYMGGAEAAGAVRGLFDRVGAKVGKVDMLVNTAGVQKLGALAEVSDEDFASLVQINLKGPFNTLREAASRMGAGGRVINLSSGTTLVLQPRYGVYAATKAALEALTTVFAREMRGRDITVNAIAPGPVATALFLKGKSKDQLDQAARQSPLDRLGEPADIASAVSFLAGPDGGWVHGQTLFVNGAFI